MVNSHTSSSSIITKRVKSHSCKFDISIGFINMFLGSLLILKPQLHDLIIV